jgi:alpha-glucosidase
MKILQLFTLFAALTCCGTTVARNQVVTSPNGRLMATISDDGGLMLAVSLDGKVLLQPSAIGLTLADGATVGRSGKMGSVRATTITDDTDAPFYRQRHIKTVANQLDIKLGQGFGLHVRAYDEGVAYRYYTTRKGKTIIQNETAAFRFDEGNKAWLAYSTNQEKPYAMAFQNTYHETRLGEARQQPAFLPVTVDCGGAKVTILESDLRS